MTLVDRYLRAVRDHLPRGQQDDIIDELSDSIQSQIEDQEANLGRPLGEDEQVALLRGFGHPMAVAARYRGEPFVKVLPIREPLDANERSFDPRACNDTNRIELRVIPHPSGHLVLMAVQDNLGKGAAGAAIQNLNLMLGLPETSGLPG